MPSIADVVERFSTELGAVLVKLGEEYQNQNEVPPSVVIIPRGDRYSAASARVTPRSALVSVATRAVGCEARIWAAATEEARALDTYADLRATELLVDRVVLALHAAAHGSLFLEDGEWLPTSLVQYGRMYVLRFRVALPVVPTEDACDATVTTYTEVLAVAGTPAGSPDAIQTTVELGTDVTGTPAP